MDLSIQASNRIRSILDFNPDVKVLPIMLCCKGPEVQILQKSEVDWGMMTERILGRSKKDKSDLEKVRVVDGGLMWTMILESGEMSEVLLTSFQKFRFLSDKLLLECTCTAQACVRSANKSQSDPEFAAEILRSISLCTCRLPTEAFCFENVSYLCVKTWKDELLQWQINWKLLEAKLNWTKCTEETSRFCDKGFKPKGALELRLLNEWVILMPLPIGSGFDISCPANSSDNSQPALTVLQSALGSYKDKGAALSEFWKSTDYWVRSSESNSFRCMSDISWAELLSLARKFETSSHKSAADRRPERLEPQLGAYDAQDNLLAPRAFTLIEALLLTQDPCSSECWYVRFKNLKRVRKQLSIRAFDADVYTQSQDSRLPVNFLAELRGLLGIMQLHLASLVRLELRTQREHDAGRFEEISSLMREMEERVSNIHSSMCDLYAQKFSPKLESIVTSPSNYLRVVQRIENIKDLEWIDFSDILPDDVVVAMRAAFKPDEHFDTSGSLCHMGLNVATGKGRFMSGIIATAAFGNTLSRQELDKVKIVCSEASILDRCRCNVLSYLEDRRSGRATSPTTLGDIFNIKFEVNGLGVQNSAVVKDVVAPLCEMSSESRGDYLQMNGAVTSRFLAALKERHCSEHFNNLLKSVLKCQLPQNERIISEHVWLQIKELIWHQSWMEVEACLCGRASRGERPFHGL